MRKKEMPPVRGALWGGTTIRIFIRLGNADNGGRDVADIIYRLM